MNKKETKMRIVIPNYHLPSINLFYSGVFWTKRKKIADEAHELVKWIVYQIKNKPPLPFKKPVRCVYTIYYKGKHRHDPSNGCIKILEDGLVQAGVLSDDSSREVDAITIHLKTNQKEDKVVIDIEEI